MWIGIQVSKKNISHAKSIIKCYFSSLPILIFILNNSPVGKSQFRHQDTKYPWDQLNGYCSFERGNSGTLIVYTDEVKITSVRKQCSRKSMRQAQLGFRQTSDWV